MVTSSQDNRPSIFSSRNCNRLNSPHPNIIRKQAAAAKKNIINLMIIILPKKMKNSRIYVKILFTFMILQIGSSEFYFSISCEMVILFCYMLFQFVKWIKIAFFANKYFNRCFSNLENGTFDLTLTWKFFPFSKLILNFQLVFVIRYAYRCARHEITESYTR